MFTILVCEKENSTKMLEFFSLVATLEDFDIRAHRYLIEPIVYHIGANLSIRPKSNDQINRKPNGQIFDEKAK